jgi:glycosyltransferase involved in cell wall biosynthesis
MSQKKLVSVIIPTYNSAQYVAEAVGSALAQTYQPVEIIVVDDGSTDDTAALLGSFGDRIRYIFQKNQGVSIARNRGIAAAHGQLIAFLDADDMWLPKKLEIQVNQLDRDPSVGLLHADAFYLDGETNQRSRHSRPPTFREGNCYIPLFLGNRILISSVLVRRECLDKVGPFDEKISKASVEDYDLWLRVARYFELGYSTEPLITYRLHGGNASKNIGLLRGNELYVLDKALRADPTLVDRVGKEEVNRRFFEIWSELGYQSFDRDEFGEANRCFGKALQYRIDLYTVVLWLASLVPGQFAGHVRWVKQRLPFGVSTQRASAKSAVV